MRAFLLTRYFTVLSLLLMGLAGGVLGHFVHRQESAQLLHMAEARNVATTRVFKNALWNNFSVLIDPSTAADADSLRRIADSLGLHSKAAELMRDSEVVKVKVYNLAGLTVFSSDPKQIGEDKRANPGFAAAVAGGVSSELSHRDSFDAFEGTKTDIDVISSYVPIVVDGRGVGVFEVYQDVTRFVAEVEGTRRMIWLTVFGVLFALYLLQLLVVRRAQRILLQQADELAAANRDLDQRVRQRTADLLSAKEALEGEVAERRRTQDQLDFLAHHDPLTGLPNRMMFQEQLKRSLGRATRAGRQLAVLFIDLDRFKDVNDTLGHAFGDELLVAVTRRLTAHLRAGDALARLGGDEFVCVIEEIGEPSEAGVVGDKLVALVEEPFRVLEHELFVSASIGVSIYPRDGEDVDTLVRNADTAMYQAKAQGRGRTNFYTPELTTYARERIRLDQLLRKALDSHEIAVHYQIKVDAVSGRPSGAEALARWTSAELGVVSPARFIPVAEDTGYIVELGAWVLRTACRQLAAWRVQGLAVPRMSVNLSVKQLERGDIVEQVRGILEDSGVDAAMLELEITESVIMAVGDAIGILERLRALGVHLAVDDFGTGYSSLSYLKLLPIQTLKIDRAFVLGIGENTGDEAIIRTVVGLATSLGLSTVAEGVDATHQADFLRAAGCNQIQGYLYGRPQPADGFVADWARLGG